jgi:hypothetical protein
VPAAATTGIEILFTVGAQTSGTWQVGNVQFEAGSIATPFERPIYGTQLAQCQRYCAKLIDFQNSGASAYGLTGTQARFSISPPLRINPTVLLLAGSWLISDDYTADKIASSVSLVANGISSVGGRAQLDGFSGLIDGRWYGSGTPISSGGTAALICSAEVG